MLTFTNNSKRTLKIFGLHLIKVDESKMDNQCSEQYNVFKRKSTEIEVSRLKLFSECHGYDKNQTNPMKNLVIKQNLFQLNDRKNSYRNTPENIAAPLK